MSAHASKGAVVKSINTKSKADSCDSGTEAHDSRGGNLLNELGGVRMAQSIVGNIAPTKHRYTKDCAASVDAEIG